MSVPVLLLLSTLSAPPATKVLPVDDVHHGTTITDPYRWLEDGKNADVVKWSDAQNAHARTFLDPLTGRDIIRKELQKLLGSATISHSSIQFRGSQVFAMKRQPPREQPFLVVMPSLDEPEKARVLLDPAELDKKAHTAIDWYRPSPDGKLVAVSLSKGGSESGDVHIYDVATGKEVFEVIPRVNGGTAGGDLAWTPDGKGFFYTRYPRGEERPEIDRDFYQQLYFHTLGTSTDSDRPELVKDLPRIAEIRPEIDEKTGRLLATVQNGDGGEFAHYLRSPDGSWKQFSTFADKLIQVTFGPDDAIFAVSREGAPRGKIVRLSAIDPDRTKAVTIVPQGDDSIVTDFYGPPTVVVTTARIYVLYQTGGPNELRAFAFDGKPHKGPTQLPVSTVDELTKIGGDDLLFTNESFTSHRGVYRFDVKSGNTTKLALTSPSPADFSDITVTRKFAISKDGTKVPVNILAPKSVKLDGSNPCLVTGYGGYGINIEPGFRANYRVLFDRGFVIAVANLRGGTEYGEEWHRNGMLTKKQNVFDDFAAVLKFMIAEKYTNSQRLGIIGGSNGGLLMGATFTQNPELMKAVVSMVGIYDMLRVELSSNGAFNIPEFGTVKDPAQFKALHGYSPYHRVRDGVKYPSILFLTGANDPRVDPLQSRKMTARLQAATKGGPVLLRTSAGTGHGGDTALSERIEELVDVYSFLFAQLGVQP